MTTAPASPAAKPTEQPLLFTPFTLRGMSTRNRIMVSPMTQCSAEDGALLDYHYGHYTAFARGAAGLVCLEEHAVERRGRKTYGDAGIYDDKHIPMLARIAEALRGLGAVPGIQLGHGGRKACLRRAIDGFTPLDAEDAAKGEVWWEAVGASAKALAPGWVVPVPLDAGGIAAVVAAWAAAARRADRAGYDFLEIHGAHGYLIHQFLSPLTNDRTDGYGGSRERRFRFALEVAQAVRAAWPAAKPLSFRVSAVDAIEGGYGIEDAIALARALKGIGVDIIDCSSGGIGGVPTLRGTRTPPGYQVPFAEAIRKAAGIPTIAVGLIHDGPQAEAILRQGKADLVAIGREMLVNPFWALAAARTLGVQRRYDLLPRTYSYWLNKRQAQTGEA